MEIFDTIICGGGPAGESAAIKISAAGKSVLLCEPREIGGTCLNRGCIPTKAYIAAADAYSAAKNSAAFGVCADNVSFDWQKIRARNAEVVAKLQKGIEFLFKKGNVKVVKAKAKILGGGEVEAVFADGKTEKFSAHRILAACGTEPRKLGFLPNSPRILDSTGAINLEECPKRPIIIGAGAIGVEFAHIWNAFGAKVELVEMMGEILPLEDPEGSRILARSFKRRGINIRTSAKLLGAEIEGDSVRARIAAPDGSETVLEGDYMLVCAGIAPDAKSLFSESAMPELDSRGFVEVDKNFQTSLENIYAVGDIIGAPLLAHTAEFEGKLAARAMLAEDGKIPADSPSRENGKIFPACTYCNPQVASVGLSEKSAREKFGENAEVSKSFFLANGKATASGHTEGFVKLVWVSDVKCATADKKLAGAQIVGANASELISECALAISAGIERKTLAKTIHPHPTLSESIAAAATF